MYLSDLEQAQCMEFIKHLTKDMRIGQGHVCYGMDMDRVAISFPDRGSESEKTANDVRDTLESEYPNVVEEWLVEESQDRESKFLVVEGWWK